MALGLIDFIKDRVSLPESEVLRFGSGFGAVVLGHV
jgi:hypothetical protein